VTARSILAIVLAATLACGGEGATGGSTVTPPPPPPPPPPLGPTSVVLKDASTTRAVNSNDQVTVHVHNNGGDGSYYLEFWALPNSPGGAPRVAQSDPVNVLAAYDETLVYNMPFSFVQSVKVKSRPVNTALYTQTDCRVVGESPSYCP
jgi:hypothetical protein